MKVENGTPTQLDLSTDTSKTANCPICQTKAVFYCQLNPASYFRCRACGTIFQNSLPTIEEMERYADQEYAEGLYKSYVQARSIKHLTFRKRLEKIAQRAKGNRVLDVGCSCGYFLDIALELGYDAYGVEFSAVAISAATTETRARITQDDVNKIASLQAETFDIVTAFDVIEHTIDPIQFLADLRKLLKPGGLLVITTPDTHHFLRPLLGKRWPMLQPLQHTVLFSRQSLALALEKTGYEQVELMAAKKVLTPDYLADQVKVYLPFLTRLYQITARVLPRKLRELPLAVNISEVMAFARREA